jgi:hypothetical protein
MKTLLLAFQLFITPLVAQDVAVRFYGPNTNGVATNFPAAWMRPGTNPPPAGWTVMPMAQALSLKAATQPTMDRYVSNRAWASEQALVDAAQTYALAEQRLEQWRSFLGTPQNPGSNFVTLGQASQWAREMLWLQQRLIRITKHLYKPEDDQ